MKCFTEHRTSKHHLITIPYHFGGDVDMMWPPFNMIDFQTATFMSLPSYTVLCLVFLLYICTHVVGAEELPVIPCANRTHCDECLAPECVWCFQGDVRGCMEVSAYDPFDCCTKTRGCSGCVVKSFFKVWPPRYLQLTLAIHY